MTVQEYIGRLLASRPMRNGACPHRTAPIERNSIRQVQQSTHGKPTLSGVDGYSNGRGIRRDGDVADVPLRGHVGAVLVEVVDAAEHALEPIPGREPARNFEELGSSASALPSTRDVRLRGIKRRTEKGMRIRSSPSPRNAAWVSRGLHRMAESFHSNSSKTKAPRQIRYPWPR